MAIRALIALLLLIAIATLISPASASALRELGVPVAGMQTMAPCWPTSAFKHLVEKSGFSVRTQGILTESIDTDRPVFLLYTHEDGRFIAVIRQHKKKLICVSSAGDGVNSF